MILPWKKPPFHDGEVGRNQERQQPAVMVCRCLWVALSVCAFTLLLGGAGCETTPNSNAAANTSADPATQHGASRRAAEPQDPRFAAALREVERRYVIGPRAAREMGYRIDWQHPAAGTQARLVHVEADAVYVLDRGNYLVRIDRDSGTRVWDVPVAESIQEIFGINYIGDRVYITTGSAVLVLDAESGSLIARQRLDKVANTHPIQYGQFLVYGSRNGQLNWHSYPVGFHWRGYELAPTINVPPVRYQNSIVVAGGDGTVAVLSASDARMRWNRRLLAPVIVKPAVGHGAVVFAGTDQHIWAYDLHTGRNIWRRLTESSLHTPPAIVGDRAYQYVPEKGLKCFEAYPFDEPDGVLNWTASTVSGHVVGHRDDRLFVWDPDETTFFVVEKQRGGVMSRLDLPQVRQLVLPTPDADEVFAISDDGRLVRLVPRN